MTAYEVLGDERVGQGGHLVIRRLKLRLILADGTRTQEGSWDFVERPMGLDAVVLAIWRRRAGAGSAESAGLAESIEVLLRSSVRVPLWFGRTDGQRLLLTELVAGILEPGDELMPRAIAEAREEAGLTLTAVQPLGPPMFPTPGMCAERFHFFSCEVAADAEMQPPEGDGSVFEQGAQLEWVALDEALRRCGRGEIQDVKTELGLRRLREQL